MPRSKEGLVRLLTRQGIDERVIDAFRRVDRADFVPPESKRVAYADRPVVLPQRQTTSQPSLIARMIQAASPTPSDKVLEVGTGYGFQTALLAQLASQVVSIERFPELADAAGRNLEAVGITNVRVLKGDGWKGAPEASPFDAIVVSAAASEVPRPLGEQLTEGGRLVIPVARPTSDDVLLFVKKDGQLEMASLLTPARFVPLVPSEEW